MRRLTVARTTLLRPTPYICEPSQRLGGGGAVAIA
jgi:hypothetical protein